MKRNFLKAGFWVLVSLFILALTCDGRKEESKPEPTETREYQGAKLSSITVLKQTLPPVAKFYSDVTQGYAPLAVQFTDISENATERYWDFGDGTHSSAVTPVHIYKAGKYTVSLTVMNGNGMDTETKSKYITVTKKK